MITLPSEVYFSSSRDHACDVCCFSKKPHLKVNYFSTLNTNTYKLRHSLTQTKVKPLSSIMLTNSSKCKPPVSREFSFTPEKISTLPSCRESEPDESNFNLSDVSFFELNESDESDSEIEEAEDL